MNDSDDLKSRVQKFLSEEVAPFLQMDGGEIELIDFQDGVARIRLNGSCGPCPTTFMTVIMSIEEELRRRIPEVEHLQVAP